MQDRPLEISLLLLRVTVFVVMLVWTLDKFINPGHAGAVYEKFYFVGGLGPSAFYVIGAVELALLVGFLAGVLKTWTYGFVVLAHGVSTVSAWQKYLDPYTDVNLLFFAAIPMLAACITLFLLRDRDRLLSVA